jgi:hypothetical protein
MQAWLKAVELAKKELDMDPARQVIVRGKLLKKAQEIYTWIVYVKNAR